MTAPLEFLRRRTRLIALLVLAAMLATAGQLGLGALQVTAWSAMVVGYTQQTGSVGEALAKTFDGAHPCSLCEEVKQLASEHQQQDQQKPEREQLHMPLALSPVAEIIVSRPDGEVLTAAARVWAARTVEIAVPPPRA